MTKSVLKIRFFYWMKSSVRVYANTYRFLYVVCINRRGKKHCITNKLCLLYVHYLLLFVLILHPTSACRSFSHEKHKDTPNLLMNIERVCMHMDGNVIRQLSRQFFFTALRPSFIFVKTKMQIQHSLKLIKTHTKISIC